MKRQTIYIIIALIASTLLGAIFGYSIKKCNKVVSRIEVHDTTYRSYPVTIEVHDTSFKKSTKFIHDTFIVNHKTNKNDTIFINKDCIGFYSNDTIIFDSLISVNIQDVYNCNGRVKRDSKLIGNLKERVINNTITNNILLPRNIFQLNAGITSNFTTKKLLDLGPCVSLSYKDRFNLSYSYLIDSRVHSASITKKIK